jgi:hypothetical protein
LPLLVYDPVACACLNGPGESSLRLETIKDRHLEFYLI